MKIINLNLQLLRRDVYDVIEKESALTRELTLTPGLDVRSTYEFYFRVDDFTRRVGADVGIFRYDTMKSGIVLALSKYTAIPGDRTRDLRLQVF